MDYTWGLKNGETLFGNLIMIETEGHLKNTGIQPPICFEVHVVFKQNAIEDLMLQGVSRIIICNTIPHKSNAIDLSEGFIKEFKN